MKNFHFGFFVGGIHGIHWDDGLTFCEGGASWAFLYRFGGCSVRLVRVLDK